LKNAWSALGLMTSSLTKPVRTRNPQCAGRQQLQNESATETEADHDDLLAGSPQLQLRNNGIQVMGELFGRDCAQCLRWPEPRPGNCRFRLSRTTGRWPASNTRLRRNVRRPNAPSRSTLGLVDDQHRSGGRGTDPEQSEPSHGFAPGQQADDVSVAISSAM
jgi:hypothetical protein